jgi:mRNA-degrading endonuclease RelE of RelBE toxin-antitoxin system
MHWYNDVMQVQLTPSASAELLKLPAVIQARTLRVIRRLRDWPAVSGAKPLRHGLAGRYRIRTGDYRVQFYAQGQIVTVEKIGHRDGFYEE